MVDHLPREAAEAVLEIATGGNPAVPTVAARDADPFDHPDAQSRFRVMTNVEELERALEFPWEKWSVFLHPTQRQLVERDYGGAARVSGSAGTGKTIVALHRAVHLARENPDARILLTTFSDTLAAALSVKLRALIRNEPRIAERVEVAAISTVTKRLAQAQLGAMTVVADEQVRARLVESASGLDVARFTPAFLWDDPRQLVGKPAREIPTGKQLAQRVFENLVGWSRTQIDTQLYPKND